MSFIRTGLREIGLKVRRQRTRLALRHEKRLLQKSEINLGREGTSQAGNFPELRPEVELKLAGRLGCFSVAGNASPARTKGQALSSRLGGEPF